MKNPDISVVMPVHNGGKYLKEAIDSILNQTYYDFELIIINDGSTDNSKSLINSYSDERIKVIEQTNKGFAESLNIAASYCRGKYIARMDQDDISNPDRFLSQYTFLETHPKISVLSCAVCYINETGKPLGRSFTITWPISVKKKLLHSGCIICHPGVMMRKKDFDDVEGYSETLGGRVADYHLWVKFVKKGYKIQNLSKVLLRYRILESSMSSEFSITHSAKKILVKVIKKENPDSKEISDLHNACQIDKEAFKKRFKVYNNKQNLVYSKLTFLGENTKNQLFSGVKNLATLFSLNF